MSELQKTEFSSQLDAAFSRIAALERALRESDMERWMNQIIMYGQFITFSRVADQAQMFCGMGIEIALKAYSACREWGWSEITLNGRPAPSEKLLHDAVTCVQLLRPHMKNLTSKERVASRILHPLEIIASMDVSDCLRAEIAEEIKHIHAVLGT